MTPIIEVRSRLLGFGVCTLSDALDRLGIEGQCLGIHAFDRHVTLAGPAFTVKMVPVGTSKGTVGDYIDDVEAGHVVVIDNGGRLDATVWGDILTTTAKRNGVQGTVIDGVCRDITASLNVDYPIFARGNAMRTGKDRVTADAFNCVVDMANVRVAPCDWVVGDGDGVVVIPLAAIDIVMEVAEEISATEQRIRAAIADGGRLDVARQMTKYHKLQSRLTE